VFVCGNDFQFISFNNIITGGTGVIITPFALKMVFAPETDGTIFATEVAFGIDTGEKAFGKETGGTAFVTSADEVTLVRGASKVVFVEMGRMISAADVASSTSELAPLPSEIITIDGKNLLK